MRRFFLVAMLLGAGCSHSGVLVAENGEHRFTARDPATGVTVVLTMGVWEGNPQSLDEEITVMHVLVANDGEQPLLLAPGDLELRDLRGFHYELLDTGATFHRAQEAPAGAGTYARAYQPDYDIGRSADFGWLETSGDAAYLALPWGVLEPGTQMRGYVYFEPVVSTANGAQLVWHMSTPQHEDVVQMQFDLFRSAP